MTVFFLRRLKVSSVAQDVLRMIHLFFLLLSVTLDAVLQETALLRQEHIDLREDNSAISEGPC